MKIKRLILIILLIMTVFLAACSSDSDLKKYKLEVTIEGEGTVKPGAGNYNKNKELNLEAIPEEGWEFLKWESDITGSSNKATLVMVSDKFIKAIFKGKISFNSIPDQVVTITNPISFKVEAVDPDGDSLTYSASGDLAQYFNKQTQEFAWTPSKTDIGEYELIVSATDGTDTVTETITIIVKETNKAPQLVTIGNKNGEVGEEISFIVSASDSDGDDLSYSASGDVADKFNAATQIFTWTPVVGEEGNYSLTIEVSDGNLSDSETIIISIGDVNQPPLANEDTVNVDEDKSVTIDLLANDSDPDGDSLVMTEVTNGSNGLVVDNEDGTVTYTPDENYNGIDTFNYTISDGELSTSTEVEVTINPVNDSPTAIDDMATVNEDEIVIINVLENDSDLDDDSLVITQVTNGSNGAVIDNGDGTVTYTPTINFNGTDTFNYIVSDGELTATAEVEVTINPINDTPVLTAIGNKSVDEGELLEFIVSASDIDGDDLSYSAKGDVVDKFDSSTQTFSWTPSSEDAGNYSLTIDVSDGNLSDSETITISVGDVNRYPIAVTDIISVEEDKSVTIDLLANDSDPDGDDISLTQVNNASNGTVIDNGDGTATYTPDADFAGTDSFSYTISDSLITATGTVELTITAVNDAPVLAPIENKSLKEGELLEFMVSANDIDGDDLSYSAKGDLVDKFDSNSGVFRWNPDYDSAGQYSLIIKVSDGVLDDSQSIEINVANENRSPTAVNDAGTTAEDNNLTIDLISNDSDPDGDKLTVIQVSDGTNGTTTNNGDGTVTYIPDQNYNGTDNFSYDISDGNGSTAAAVVDITVTAVNDAPVLNAIGNKSVNEGELLEFTVSASDIDEDNLTYNASGDVADKFDSSTKTFTWTPSPDDEGNYSLTIDVSDGDLNDSETITISVGDVNRAPVASDDTVNVDEDNSVVIDILANDSDPDGDSINLIGVTDGNNGTVVDNGDGTVTYTPDENYNGADIFNYTISDGTLTATGEVKVTINSVNDIPTATNDTVEVAEDDVIVIYPLINDSDLDGDNLLIDAVSTVTNGTAVDNGDGTITYTPNSNYNGSDSFSYDISDSNGGTATAAVDITVTAVNDAPVLSAIGNKSVNEGELLEFTVSASDIDEDNLTYNASGDVADKFDSSTQTFTWTPSFDDEGNYSLTIDVSDGDLNDSETITISVGDVNRAPVASDDTVNVDEDNSVVIDILANDSDPDGDSINLIGVTDGNNGTAVDNGNGTVTYTPNENYNGTDSFNYDINDGRGGTATGAVNITINAINDDPIAVDDSATVDEDGSVFIDVFANDTDVDGDLIGFDNLFPHGSANNGSVSIEGLGEGIRYKPDADYNGSDSFTYNISDGNGGTATGRVNVTINAIDDPPVIDSITDKSVDEGQRLNFTVTASDIEGDTITLSVNNLPVGANFDLDTGEFDFTPDYSQSGEHLVTFVATANGESSNESTVITVNDVNRAPTAEDDSFATDEDTAKTIDLTDLLLNDSDLDGDSLSIVGSTAPANGTVVNNGDGTVTYTPDANYNGTDSFTYDISDGSGGSDTATVDLTINPINDLPVATNDSVTVDEDGSILIDIVANDTDIDGDTISITGFTSGTDGTVAQEGDSLRYTPDADFNGSDSFTYDIGDGMGGIATGTVDVTINAVNDVPVAADDTAEVDQDSTVLIDVLTNDSDIDGDTISITGFTSGTDGTVAQEGDSLRYTPDAGYTGTDSFTYDMEDGNGGTATATVNLTVNATSILSMDIDEPSGDTGYIEVTIANSGSYQIVTSFYEQSCDTAVMLYDSSQNLIASNDDYDSMYGELHNQNLAAGTYYVRVQEFSLAQLYCHLEISLEN
ncbi:tandem-95 repeat protein [Halanaerobacter jeridensis]|uniref:Thioredoxin-related protein n=1 Tax=Halanaerobacter jeridensis TaxID=706427 RepID=A0A939BPW9_9FIRM|nr:tandem-95 repeat protein [Halanaerobacter jeridensis]MBM7557587.1 thioredoxin-related protein [Halanaerobacter jeridensis]